MNEKTLRRLTAIVSADVVGYSRLIGDDETGTISALRQHRAELIDVEIDAHGGRIVKTMGDGLLLEFPSVVDAVRCAVAVQDGMGERNTDTPEDKQIVFCIGVNLGDIVIDGDDILGDGVNIAARLEALAEPGGICISQRVYENVQDRLEIAFIDLGKRELKNFSRPVNCWAWQQGAVAKKSTKIVAEFMDAPALAVLPFNSFSQDPEYEFFADGLSKDLTTLLAAYRDFPVIARNSAFTFKGKDIDVMEAGQQLGANYVVEGSVRVAGTRMRVNALLIDVKTGHHLWAQKFDRNFDDIFTLQDELSLQIASNISPTVVRNENTRVSAATPGEIGQWGALIKVRKSLIVAHSNKARRAHWREGRAEMMRYARRAVEADPANSLAYHCLSCAEQYHGHAEAALQAAERAIELNPCAMHGYFWSGASKILLGRAEEALADLAILERLSPLDPELYIKNIATSRALHVLQRYDEAVDAAPPAVQMMPDAPFVYLSLISALALSGRIERAKQEVETFHTKFPDLEIEPELVHFVTREPDDLERFKQGLRDANLNLA